VAYRISSLLVKNFKCFDNKKFYRFHFDESKNPVILSGPNGFGKTTFFDAVELIFTKNITRLHKPIEHGKTKLGGNILLNDTANNGILVLNLIDEQLKCEVLSIVAVIDRKQNNLSVEESLRYNISDSCLENSDSIEQFVNTAESWKDSLLDFNKLTYKLDHFAVYYYISQAESVHFLKKKIDERKNSINTLLKTDAVDNYINHIEKNLIGASNNRTDVLVNASIIESKRIIDNTVSLIKSKTNISDIRKVDYAPLFKYSNEMQVLPWDSEDIDFDSNNLSVSLERMIFEIRSLHNYLLNKNDYELYLKNNKISSVINNRGIDDFCRYYSFINQGTVDCEKITQSYSINQKKMDVYIRSEFFRNQLDISLFNKDMLMDIKKIDESLILSSINDMVSHVNSLNDISKGLSDNQKMLNGLSKARDEFRKFVNKLDVNGRCPYCAHQFENSGELDDAFASLSSELSESKTSASEMYSAKLKKFKLMLENDCERILKYINGLDDNTIEALRQLVNRDKQFVDSAKRIEVVEKIYSYIELNDSWHALNDTERAFEVNRLMNEKIMSYANPNFIGDNKKYDFGSINAKYRDIFDLGQGEILHESVENKINYLRYKYSLLANSEILTLKEIAKKEITKKFKLEVIRDKLKALKKLYEGAIKSHANQVSKQLRVPLLIYSCKILQDYQNGLGVFINKDEMRFVSNGDTKHDILNTFSSGQLSGFILSFLFAMNKQYILKSNDDIGFILIDDPVQTMDDINIASLIEVLRNDFGRKQIILSTHETDKENYILYKFLKYKLRGQSFNVKERLYV